MSYGALVSMFLSKVLWERAPRARQTVRTEGVAMDGAFGSLGFTVLAAVVKPSVPSIDRWSATVAGTQRGGGKRDASASRLTSTCPPRALGQRATQGFLRTQP